MKHKPEDYKLNKRQVRAILKKLRADKSVSVEEQLRYLNDNKGHAEILLESWAKILGYDRHYSLMTYAWDDSDGEEAFDIAASVK